jgi:hypothetical protein
MHKPILRRVGIILILAGSVDIAWMIYSIWRGHSYSSSLNIFAVIAGVFLVRGSLRTAVIVRTVAAFSLTALVCLVPILFMILPTDLISTEIRLDPSRWGGSIGVGIAGLVLFGWVVRELGRTPVRIAVQAAGRRDSPVRLAVFAGIALPIVVGLIALFATQSDAARRAVAEVEHRLGPDYRYAVTALTYKSDSTGKHTSGRVTAWNDHQIVEVPFAWDEAQ